MPSDALDQALEMLKWAVVNLSEQSADHCRLKKEAEQALDLLREYVELNK